MTEHEVRERLRFLSAAQHETNTPLAVIRGWADTFAGMWEDLAPADRERGVASIQRQTGALARLLDALFVELRADTYARSPVEATADLAQVVADTVEQLGDVTVEGEVPGIAVAASAGAVEVLLTAAALGLRERCGGPVSVEVRPDAGGALVALRSAGGGPGPDVDPFDPFPGGTPSPAGIRLYAARRLVRRYGGDVRFTAGGLASITLPGA